MTLRCGEDGLTLVEVLVSLSLFLLALLMFGGSLTVAQRLQVTNAEYSKANDQLQLALQTIDRQIRSGYVVTVMGSPPTGADAAVKIFTQADGAPKCVIWAVGPSASAVKSLYTTSWNVPGGTAPTTLSGGSWIPMATNLWNYVPPNNEAPFTSVAAYGQVLPKLDVRFLINAGQRGAATATIATTFTSRNVPRSLEAIPGTVLTAGSAC